MSALIDCLEFLPKGAARRWLLVRNPHALLQQAEFSWTTELDQATRFDDAQAEHLKANAAELLPLLPTELPTVPAFVRVVHGHYTEPELPAVRRDPQLSDEAIRRQRDRVAAAEASLVHHRPVTPDEVYRETVRRTEGGGHADE